MGFEQQSISSGVAKQTTDPDIVAATMAKPGGILKRPMGTEDQFAEDTDPPTDLVRMESTKAN